MEDGVPVEEGRCFIIWLKTFMMTIIDHDFIQNTAGNNAATQNRSAVINRLVFSLTEDTPQLLI